MTRRQPAIPRAALGVPILLLLLSAAPPRARAAPPALVARARAWLDALSPAQRERALLRYADADRRNWHYVPRRRRGLAFREMTTEQRRGAMAILDAALSDAGRAKARGVFALEAELQDALPAGTRQRDPTWRDPGEFHVAIFDAPTPEGRWGLRVEGHHLSVNVTIEADRVTASTPLFFGANPSAVRRGPRAGLRPLASEEDRARALLQALDADRRRRAVIDARAPGDVIGGPGRLVGPSGQGLARAEMREDQQAAFLALIATYLDAVDPAFAAARMAEIRETPPERLRFLWFGGDRPGVPHAYRIEGPTVFIEYVNRGDHVHTVWRDPRGDFGTRSR